MKVCTIQEMQTLRQQAEHQFQLSAEMLMEHVGMAAQQFLSQEIGVAGKRFVIFCGSGTIVGYGCVAARQIHVHGGHVRLYCTDEPENFTGAVQQQLTRLRCLPIEVTHITSADAAKVDVLHSDAVIDALLNFDIVDDVAGSTRDIIDMLNASRRPILSLDLPSGIHADTGRILGAAVRATHTLACGALKAGNVLYPGYEYCGKLALTTMSLPPALTKSDALQLAINHPPQLPSRSVTGHKGTFGDVLVIAGAGNYYGAPYFSAAAVLKAGGGYSRLAAPASIIPVIAGKGSEMVFVPQQETDNDSIALSNKQALLELAEKVDFVILGPGLSLHEETQQLVRELTASLKKPLLIDGDGITALCQESSLLRHREAETILTPHLGEMARLTKMSVRDIAADPLALLQRTACDLNAYIVMKGAHSLIGYLDGRVFVNMSGNSGMGTAGSGDVLTGTIAAMFGLGLSVPEAVRKGVFMHGFSGDLSAQKKGEDGITAQDILDFLPLALKFERDTLPEELQHRYLLTLP